MFDKIARKFINKYSKSGIIHVGANVGQERRLYSSLDKEVIWIEPDPDTYGILQNNIKHLPKQKAICALILDEEKDVKFNVSNLSTRSSVYDFTDHHFKNPKFKHIKTITLHSTRLDSMDLDNYDTLVTDTQGADLSAIKSLGDKIINFNLIICEVFHYNRRYKNVPLFPEYDAYLYSKGFKRSIPVTTPSKHIVWSNFIYVKA